MRVKYSLVNMVKTKDHNQLLEILNEVLAQTTRMDKAIDRLERKMDTRSRKDGK